MNILLATQRVINLSYNQNKKCYNEVVVHLDNRISSFDELPLTLTVEEVADILGICKANAYSLCHNRGFPAIKVGKRFIIPKPAFVLWMSNPKGG